MQDRFLDRVKRLVLVILAGAVVLGGIYAFQQRAALRAGEAELQHLADVNELTSLKSEVAAMESLRQQFLNTRDPSFAEHYQSHRADAVAIARALNDRSQLTLSDDLNDRVESLGKAGELSMEHQYVLGLSENQGLEGALRSTVHDLERELKSIGDDRLLVLMLMMRRHEKDFILRQRGEYVDQLEERAREIQNTIRTRIADTSTAVRLSELTGTYAGAFRDYANLSMVAGETTAGLEQDYTFLSEALDARLARAQDFASRMKVRRLNLEGANRRILFFGSLALILIVGGGYILFRHDNEFQALLEQQRKLIEQGEALERLNAANEALAMEDALTALPNRRAFFAELETLIIRQKSDLGSFSIGLVDIDGFKLINDLYGHGVGDELLRQVSARLTDALGTDFYLARLGGDEFGIIFPDISDDDLLKTIGGEITGALSLPFELSTGRAKVAATLGIAKFPEAAQSAGRLFEHVDYALFHAKQHARGQTVIFSDDHRNAIQYAAAVEQALHEANLEEELQVYFQPIINTARAEIASMEALGRWTHNDLGPVAPDVFIRAAEQTGTINHVTRILLRKALASAKDWPVATGLNFNLSALDLAPHAMLQIVAIIESSGISPKRLTMEITETAMMQDLDQAVGSLSLLRNLGVQIALDDFGTGYSSLSYLHKMPIDRVKIDRSFIIDLEEADTTRDIVRAIQSLCSSLSLDCVIEGVETKAQQQILASMGCALMQGYHYSRPVDAGKAVEVIAAFSSDPARLRNSA